MAGSLTGSPRRSPPWFCTRKLRCWTGTWCTRRRFDPGTWHKIQGYFHLNRCGDSHWNGNWQVFHFTVLQGRSPGALTTRSTSRPRERTTRLEVNRGENQPILVATNDYSESCSGQRRMGEGCQRETELVCNRLTSPNGVDTGLFLGTR